MCAFMSTLLLCIKQHNAREAKAMEKAVGVEMNEEEAERRRRDVSPRNPLTTPI